MSLSSLFLLTLVAAPLLVFAVVLWRRELLMALPIFTILNGVPITVHGTSLRIDQIVACLLVIPLVASVVSGRRRLRMDAASWWLVALLLMNLTASVLNSPARMYSLLQCANLASSWVIYLLLLNFLETREELTAFFNRCLWGALIASCIGIAAFVLAIAGLPVGGAEVSVSAAERLAKAYGAFGTMVEPNLFGSFTGAHFVLAVALLAIAPRRPAGAVRIRLAKWTAALTAIGLVLSFTRSAWLGVIAALIALFLFARRSPGIRVRRVLVPLSVGVAIVLLLALLPGTAGTLLRFKLANLVNLQSQTVGVRLVTYALALEQTVQHPFIGWGTFTFAPLVAQANDFAQFENWRNLWIGNYVLLALHDTGIVGLTMWIGLLWTIVAGGVRATRRVSAIDPEAGSRTLALTLAVASLLIPFLATTGFTLGYPWLLIGLLGAHARLAGEGRAIQVPNSPHQPLIPLPIDAT